jgi:hypothetical protein
MPPEEPPEAPPEEPPDMPPEEPPDDPPEEPPEAPPEAPPLLLICTAQPLITTAIAAASRDLRSRKRFRLFREREFIALSPHLVQCTIALCAGNGLHFGTDINASWRVAS